MGVSITKERLHQNDLLRPVSSWADRGPGAAGEKKLVKPPPQRPGFQRLPFLWPREQQTTSPDSESSKEATVFLTQHPPLPDEGHRFMERRHIFQAIFHTPTRSELGNHVSTIHESSLPIDRSVSISVPKLSCSYLFQPVSYLAIISLPWKPLRVVWYDRYSIVQPARRTLVPYTA